MRSCRLLLTRWTVPVVLGVSAFVTIPTAPGYASTAITGVRVTDVTHTSFSVRLDSQGDGWKYGLYASTDKTDVFYNVLHSAPYQSSLRSKPRVTLDGLKFSTDRYWWRVQAVKNGHFRTGSIKSIGLRPDAPTGLAPNAGVQGVSLSWGGGGSNGFQVQQATNPAFTTGVHTYTARGLGKQFSPFGLASGTTYSFRVRSSNWGTPSAWTPVVDAAVTTQSQTARVGQFNVHDVSKTGNTLPSWQDRRDAVVASIQDGHPDVLAMEEGGGSIDGSRCGKRQADDIVDRLGGDWKLADTELAPCTGAGWVRTGVYVAFDGASYRAVGPAGHWQISDPSASKRWWAAYQELENKTTGARFLMVATHLIVGNKLTLDKEREQQTQRLIAHVNGLGLAVPAVYAGDFNSHEKHEYDGPAIAMRAADNADAFFVAQSRVNARYNSANDYKRRPPHEGLSIDHIYGSPGVALRTWQLVMKLKAGEYVGVIPSDHNLLVSDITYPY